MNSRPITRAFLVVFVSLLTLLVRAIPAGAQTAPTTSYTFTVTTTNDTHDVNPGDGVCADSNGMCSLRAATEEADALPAGSSITITVPAGMYALMLGTLGLTANTFTIHGAGSTSTIISGNQTFGIIYISHKMFAHLSQLTIEGGSAPSGLGGGIENYGTLTVQNSSISNNSAGTGGGISNSGTLTVQNSSISNNSAPKGGIENDGGGIFNSGTLMMSNSSISNNSAPNGSGGGIFNSGTLTVSNSSISNNSAYDAGGGIDNGSSGIFNGTGTLTVSSSTISNNSTYGSGGGIYNFDGTLTVSSSTISNNPATSIGSYGGGIYNSEGTVTVSNSTISNNSAYGDYHAGGDIENYPGFGGWITLTGTIVANSPTGENCDGPITDGGYNLDSGATCGFSLGSDLNNTDPMLGPLVDNGGPTQTMALLPGSKAIDWVAASSRPITDQRGYPRPDGSGESTCDIGAYESAY